MSSRTPLLDILSTHLPNTISSAELSTLSSSQTRSAVETLLTFALGGNCPTRLIDARKEWSRNQPTALKALHDSLGTKSGVKRTRDSPDDTDHSASKRQKTVEADDDDPPLFTFPSISATSPVRKKVDVTVHARSIRFVNPATRVLESSVPLESITRVFLLPTRGKTKGHWTVALLPADVPDKTKVPPSSAQQIIFGLDALSAAAFETTTYSSGTTPTSTTAVAKGEETATSIRRLLSHIPIPLLEPSATVFRSACATSKAGDGAAGIDAYLSAKSGTLWFFDSGILWGESKPCEFWAVSDLIAKDGVRLISATGRTCSVILGRKSEADDGDEVIETVFSMVDGREQDPIHAWARNRKHVFGKAPAGSAVSAQSQPATGTKERQQANGTVKGPAWDDSDSDDEDFQGSSEDLEGSSSESEESEDGSRDESQAEGTEDSGDELEGEEEELQEARHPLLRPGAMPRMSTAAIDMAVTIVRDDFLGDVSEEEDELEE